jgi:hypothetical protein
MSTFNLSGLVNGKVDTGRSTLDNLEALADVIGAYVSYDTHEGLWKFTINESTDAIHNFDDSNIIGGINVAGTGLFESFNSVEVGFPHRSLADQRDYRRITIPDLQLNPNEPLNKMVINLDAVNSPVEAEKLALRELKQARANTVVTFKTDFQQIGLQGGDVITITNTPYGWDAKEFRIIRISEEDTDDGSIVLSITALEYDEAVYDYSNLQWYIREKNTNIPLRRDIINMNQADDDELKNKGFPSLDTFNVGASVSVVQSTYRAYGTPTSYNSGYPANGGNVDIPFQLETSISNLLLIAASPFGTFTYKALTSAGQQTNPNTFAFITSLVTLFYEGNQIQQATVDWQTSSTIFQLADAQPGNYIARYSPIPTYDLNQAGSIQLYHYDQVIYSDANGNGITVSGYGFDN